MMRTYLLYYMNKNMRKNTKGNYYYNGMMKNSWDSEENSNGRIYTIVFQLKNRRRRVI